MNNYLYFPNELIRYIGVPLNSVKTSSYFDCKTRFSLSIFLFFLLIFANVHICTHNPTML